MRGLLLLTLLLTLLGATLVLVGCGDTPGAARALVPEGEPLVQAHSAGVIVTGEIRNTAQRPYTGTLQVTLRDADGKAVGTAAGAVNDVPPGGTMPYTAVGQTPAGPWERAEVAVTAQIPR